MAVFATVIDGESRPGHSKARAERKKRVEESDKGAVSRATLGAEAPDVMDESGEKLATLSHGSLGARRRPWARMHAIAARLETRLLASPLEAFTPAAAELLREALGSLAPVLRTASFGVSRKPALVADLVRQRTEARRSLASRFFDANVQRAYAGSVIPACQAGQSITASATRA